MADHLILDNQSEGSSLPVSLALTIFTFPLSQCSLNLRYGSYVVNVSVMGGKPTISCSLHLDQMWFSLVVSASVGTLDER